MSGENMVLLTRNFHEQYFDKLRLVW